MAFIARKMPDAITFALVAAHNKSKIDGVGASFHYDITTTQTGDYTAPVLASDTVATANATDLTTSIALTNSIKKTVNRHYASAYVLPLTGGSHKVTNTAIATADGTDLTSSVTLANAIKSSYNTHIASTTFHANADGTNAVAAANATDQTTLNTLVNAQKTAFNAHIISAPAGAMLTVVDA
jgi:hypothetical protein